MIIHVNPLIQILNPFNSPQKNYIKEEIRLKYKRGKNPLFSFAWINPLIKFNIADLPY